MNDIGKWLAETFGAKSVREAARKIDTSHATLTRHMRGDQAEHVVIALARKYERPPVAALVSAGKLEPHEFAAVAARGALHEFSDLDLAQEIMDRIEKRTATETLTEPIGGDQVLNADESIDITDTSDAEVKPTREPRRED